MELKVSDMGVLVIMVISNNLTNSLIYLKWVEYTFWLGIEGVVLHKKTLFNFCQCFMNYPVDHIDSPSILV